jgi:8-oxo-dGTP pyrophosphatase MutT (NUDIX family)
MSKSDRFSFSKPKWNIVQDKKVWETPIFSLQQIELLPDKKENTVHFYRLEAPEWINVIALTPENEVLLVEQYRVGVDETTLEIPGGMVDPGEGPLKAAQRELLEETGYRSDHWVEMGKTSANPAIQTNYTHLYLAKECKKIQEPENDGNEDILVHSLPMNKFLKLVKNGTIHHAIVLAAVAQYLLAQNELT